MLGTVTCLHLESRAGRDPGSRQGGAITDMPIVNDELLRTLARAVLPGGDNEHERIDIALAFARLVADDWRPFRERFASPEGALVWAWLEGEGRWELVRCECSVCRAGRAPGAEPTRPQ